MGESSNVLETIENNLNNVIASFKNEINKYKCGRADKAIIENIKVQAYGNLSPIFQIASISIIDVKTLKIKPFDKNTTKDIIKAIVDKNIGLNPQEDGDSIRIFFPPMSEERRKELVKIVKQEEEKAKVTIRNLRREFLENAEKSKKDGKSKDEIDRIKSSIEKKIGEYNNIIENIEKEKEKELMKV